MGRFLLVSTVITLFRKDAIVFNADWAPERPVRLGEMMGNSLPEPSMMRQEIE